MKNLNKIALTYLKPTGVSAEILSLLEQDPIYEEVEEKVEYLEEKIKSLDMLKSFDPEDRALSISKFCDKYYWGPISSNQAEKILAMFKQRKYLKEKLEQLRDKSYNHDVKRLFPKENESYAPWSVVEL